MKCNSCGVQVPPAFTKALMDNLCPACGKEILTALDFKELIRVKTILQEAGLEEGILVSVAASISQKYDLVVRGSHKVKPPSIEDIDATEGLSDEERTRLKAMYAAKQEHKDKEDARIREEWGLEEGQMATAALTKKAGKRLIDPEMAALFTESVYGDSEVEAPLDFVSHTRGGSSANNERLARAEALKGDPGRFRITRAE